MVVIIALAALAGFALFGGPTRVPGSGGSQAAPATQPAGGEPGDGGGGEFGD